MASRKLIEEIDEMLTCNEEMETGIPNLERAKKALANKTPRQSLSGLQIPRQFYKYAQNEVANGNKIVRFRTGEVLLTDPPEYTASLWVLTPKGELQVRDLVYQQSPLKMGWA